MTSPARRDRERERERERGRKHAVRAHTLRSRRLTRAEQVDLAVGAALYPEADYPKPRTRAECVEGPRPCPYVSCRHHLYLDVQPRTGAITLNFPDLEVEEMGESCSLDVADRDGTTLEEAGAIMNLTRERIRQIELDALARLLADQRDGTSRVRLPLYAPDE